MKRTSSHQITAFYALIQALYWITYGLMFNYAAVYLQSRGFPAAASGWCWALPTCFRRSGSRYLRGW